MNAPNGEKDSTSSHSKTISRKRTMIDFGIIAAGEGSRLKEEGARQSKPMVEIEGLPMIGRMLRIMERAGAKRVNVVINPAMKDVEEYLRRIAPDLKCELKFVARATPSSLHTFHELIELMAPKDRYVVTTVDTIFGESEFERYVARLTETPADIDGVMGVTEYIDDEKPLYVDCQENGIIKAFRDEATGEAGYISAGVYGLGTSSLPVLRQCMKEGVSRMRNFQRKLIEGGLKLEAFDLGMVVDIDHIADIDKANRALMGPE